MPYDARMTTDEAGMGRQAMPARGSTPPQSACNVEPLIGVALVNPGVTERFTSRPNASIIGDSYSHRTPAVTVKLGPMRQSSDTYDSAPVARKYLSALPNPMALVCGRPR